MHYSVAFAKFSWLKCLIVLPHIIFGIFAICIVYREFKKNANSEAYKTLSSFHYLGLACTGVIFILVSVIVTIENISEELHCINNLNLRNFQSDTSALTVNAVFGKYGLKAYEYEISGHKFLSSTRLSNEDADCGCLQHIASTTKFKTGDIVTIKHWNGKILEMKRSGS